MKQGIWQYVFSPPERMCGVPKPRESLECPRKLAQSIVHRNSTTAFVTLDMYTIRLNSKYRRWQLCGRLVAYAAGYPTAFTASRWS